MNPFRLVTGWVTRYRESRCPWESYNVVRGRRWRFGVRRLLGDRVLVEHETATLPAEASGMDVLVMVEANDKLARDLEADRRDRLANPQAYADVDADG